MQNHGILVYMECADGQPVKAGLEALNAAQRLAAQQGGKPVAAVLLDSADAAAEAGAYGAAEILSAQVGGYQAECYAAALTELCQRYEADCLLMGSTGTARNWRHGWRPGWVPAVLPTPMASPNRAGSALCTAALCWRPWQWKARLW